MENKPCEQVKQTPTKTHACHIQRPQLPFQSASKRPRQTLPRSRSGLCLGQGGLGLSFNRRTAAFSHHRLLEVSPLPFSPDLYNRPRAGGHPPAAARRPWSCWMPTGRFTDQNQAVPQQFFEKPHGRSGNKATIYNFLLKCAIKLAAAMGIPEDILRSLNRLH